ncbi:MAG TPA: response regulator transcription factor [Acidimicrobiales bacterium]|nr:response regulator transcription factor [Acidimicrobiales bacterium]
MITMLVVDRAKLSAEALARALGTHDGITAIPVCPDESIEIEAARWRPALVLVGELTDEGAAACARVRTRRPDSPMLRVVDRMTAEQVEATAQAGYAGLVDRSTAMNQLVAAVEAVASGHRLFPAVREPVRRDRRGLTSRELEVLSLLDQGVTTQGIAESLLLSQHTVRNHIQRLCQKLDAHSRIEALAIARRRQLLPAVAA